MKELFTVGMFTAKDMLKRKSYIISNIIILLLIVVLFNVPNILKAIEGDDVEEGTKMLIADSGNIFEGNLNALKDMDLGYDFQISNENFSFEQIKEKINEEEIEEALVITRNDGEINIEYVVENLLYVDTVPENLVSALTAIYNNLQISKLNLTQTQLQELTPNFDFKFTQTDEQEVQGNPVVIMLLSIVLFYAIYFCAYQVSSSITTEKTSKIIETLVTSTKPSKIVLGKTLGIGIIGLIQILAMIITAVICNAVFLEEGMLDEIVNLENITPFLLVITLIYFILGYFTYALLYALTGSTVSKPEDVQSANGPVAILAVIGFYLAYFTMMNPASELNAFAALFPFSSPFCMPFRVMMGLARNMGYITFNCNITNNNIYNCKSFNKNIFKCNTKLWNQNEFKRCFENL